MPNLNARSRSFCFTLNNYTQHNSPVFETLDCRYLILGREVAPLTGTPHLQGYAYWSNPRSLRSVIAKVPGAHVEIARGTVAENRAYCSKGGDYTEYGEPPADDYDRGEEEKARWIRTLESAKKRTWSEIDADIFIRYYGALQRIANDFKSKPEPLNACCGIWIWGASGSGKSHAVEDAYPDHYKKGHNKWWDGYSGQPIAYLDDLGHGDKWLGEFYLKHWADKWPFQSESKGYSGPLRPQKFIVTSQFTIEQIWDCPETRAALRRRFVVIEKLRDQNIPI